MKTELTPQEHADMLAYRQARFERAIGPVDRPKAEAALRAVMKLVGHDTGDILWAESPRVAQVLIANLEAAAAAAAAAEVTPKYKANDVTCQLAEATLRAYGSSLTVRGATTLHSPWFTGNGFSNAWISLHSFGSRLLPPERRVEQDKLQHLESLSDTAGWIYSFTGLSIITERPLTSWTSLQTKDNPVLHSATGPSVKFPDWELFHYRGASIPRDFVMNKQRYTAQEALQWPNAEQRIALCELIGWDKILESLGNSVQVIDCDPNPTFGTLLRVDLPDAPGQQFLRAQCGTGRTIVIQVDEKAKTAVEAGAASYGISTERYRNLKART